MIKRTLFDQLKAHLSQKEITLLVGPRQAGKTTLMLMLKENLEKAGEKTVFLNLDIEADRRLFVSQETLLKKIVLEIGESNGYIFIDEIQRKEDAGLFLKGLYDMNLPYKFIVSGSGSVELKERVHESLVGRKRVFELSTLSFEEFVNFKTAYAYETKLMDFFELHKEKSRELLLDYLNFGGYPRVVLAPSLEEKQRILDEIYQSYLEKDISYLLGIQKEEAFTHLVRILTSQIGNLANVSELSSTIGISAKTVKQYLWYLEKTFVIERLTPYFQNTRKEIVKAPVFYFLDLGLRNYGIDQFGNVEDSRDIGFVFENFVLRILKEKLAYTPANLHFWRTKSGSEVDFVIERGNELIPIEVKYKEFKDPKTPRSFKNFIARYQPKTAFIVHLGKKTQISLRNTTIHFLPFYELLFTKFTK